MKNLMLKACVLTMPFLFASVNANAQLTVNNPKQQEAKLSDTIVVHLKQNNKAIIVGASIDELKRFGPAADRLKTAFLTDINTAFKEQSIYPTAKEVHYFVQDENKRRIKAEAPEYTDNKINVAYEILRLKLDLPKYSYTIYNLNNGVQMMFFVNHPDSLLPQLGDVSLNEAIIIATNNKKTVRKNYKLEVDTDSNYYRISKKVSAKSDMLEVNPYLGITLLGNIFSPLIGVQADLMFTNKYGIGKYRIGINYAGLTLLERSNGDISDISLVSIFEGKFMYNISPKTRSNSYWLGIQGGVLKSTNGGNLNNALKFGFTTEGIGPFSYSIDFINTNKFKESIYNLTIRLPF